MIYTWKCEHCETQIEVNNSLADIDLKPSASCCEAPQLKRILTTSHFIGPKQKGFFNNQTKTKHNQTQ